MSENSLSTMLMKTKDLLGAFHDVDEKKESCARGRDKPAGSEEWASVARTWSGGPRLLRCGQGKIADFQNRSALRTMSVESKPELANAHGYEFTAANAPGGSTPETGVTPPVSHFRQGSKKDVKKIRTKPVCL